MKLNYILLATLIGTGVQAETLDEAIQATKDRYSVKEQRKAERAKIHDKYKAQIKALHDKEHKELDALADKQMSEGE